MLPKLRGCGKPCRQRVVVQFGEIRESGERKLSCGGFSGRHEWRFPMTRAGAERMRGRPEDTSAKCAVFDPQHTGAGRVPAWVFHSSASGRQRYSRPFVM